MRPSDPAETGRYDERLAKVTIGEPARLDGPIVLAEHDPNWPEAFEHHAARVIAALGRRALRIEHVGSTSVPDLPAKPIIDIALEVPESGREPEYLPGLQRAGYRLSIREPEWFEHRMCNNNEMTVNLHVFSAACPEIETMVRFRDWLRSSPAERDLYAQAKRELAAREWTYVQEYADAKTKVITAILARARPRP